MLRIGLTLLMLFSACLGAEETKRLGGFSIAATSANDFTAMPETRFAWHRQALEIHQDDRLQGSDIAEMIETAIRNRLESLGYRFVDTASEADLLIAYTAAMQEALNDQELLTRFGLLPGYPALTAADSSLGRGALVLYLVDRNDGQVVWRCAAQTLVDFDAEPQMRRQRIGAGIASMLDTLPASKP